MEKMEIPKKERTVHDWYLVVYKDFSGRYNLSATFNTKSYENHLRMIRSIGGIVAIKEGATKEEKTAAAKAVDATNTGKIKNLESELLKLNFTLPREQAHPSH